MIEVENAKNSGFKAGNKPVEDAETNKEKDLEKLSRIALGSVDSHSRSAARKAYETITGKPLSQEN